MRLIDSPSALIIVLCLELKSSGLCLWSRTEHSEVVYSSPWIKYLFQCARGVITLLLVQASPAVLLHNSQWKNNNNKKKLTKAVPTSEATKCSLAVTWVSALKLMSFMQTDWPLLLSVLRLHIQRRDCCVQGIKGRKEEKKNPLEACGDCLHATCRHVQHLKCIWENKSRTHLHFHICKTTCFSSRFNILISP